MKKNYYCVKLIDNENEEHVYDIYCYRLKEAIDKAFSIFEQTYDPKKYYVLDATAHIW